MAKRKTKEKDTDWNYYVEQGITCKNKKNYNDAIINFKKALSIFGEDSFFICTLLSVSYREKGEYDTSIEYCNKSIETLEVIDAESYEYSMAIAYNELALNYLAKNEKKQAITFFKQSADNGGTDALNQLEKLGITYKSKIFVRKGQYGTTNVPDF